jgi:TRAP-type C4-dicarboxylate transport system substrate-binding protein
MFRKLVGMFAAGALVVSTANVAGAVTTFKIGTTAPADSTWGKEYKKLVKDVSDDTNGELQIDFQFNGQAGDEHLMVEKIRSGQLDAAAITATGLAATGVKDVLVFMLPGIFDSWAKSDSARAAMKDEFDKRFEAKGFTLMGWGDVGAAKTMSVGFEVRHPSDLRGKGVPFFSDDPVTPKMYSAIGGITPKQVSIAEILPGLTSGSINVLTTPAIAAEQLQWASRITHINTETTTFIIGGLIASSARLQTLPPKLREALDARGKEMGHRLDSAVRRIDAQAFERMKKSKQTYELTPAEHEEWRHLFVKIAKELRGSVFDPAIFDRVIQLSGYSLTD